LVGRQEGHPACKKLNDAWGVGVDVVLERGADLHMAQLVPLPLTVSCPAGVTIGRRASRHLSVLRCLRAQPRERQPFAMGKRFARFFAVWRLHASGKENFEDHLFFVSIFQ